MQGVRHMSWHCGCDVIYVNQEESRRYYTTLGNTLSKLVCWSSRLTSLLLFYWRGSHWATCTFCPVHLLAEALVVAPLSKLCRRPLTGQRKLPEPSSSLGRHLRCPASKEPVGLRCFGIVHSPFVLKPELSLTQDAIWAFCWWSSPEAFQHSWADWSGRSWKDSACLIHFLEWVLWQLPSRLLVQYLSTSFGYRCAVRYALPQGQGVSAFHLWFHQILEPSA